MLWTKGGALGDIQKTAAKETRSNDIQRKILIVNKTYIVETPHWQEATIKRPSKWGTKQKDKHLFFMKRYEDKIPQPLRCHSNPRFGSNYSCVPTVFFFFCSDCSCIEFVPMKYEGGHRFLTGAPCLQLRLNLGGNCISPFIRKITVCCLWLLPSEISQERKHV